MIDGITYQDPTSSGNNGYDWQTSDSGHNYNDSTPSDGPTMSGYQNVRAWIIFRPGQSCPDIIKESKKALSRDSKQLFEDKLRKRAWRRQK